ncbi:CoA-binding domain-containing protein [Fictibacillus macauensis ZFHKF-1]|uniref:CoA-binding domain-containing protein n=1 Tax=Fictibacillus macauensis ZFHKF-1 TaxID=1196324 RepID=I8AL93_9BACL|nr:CoA-binding protein [Fictibacillus macauensis]EIT86652.1 CoA-binding domain-containing protein [Fictibacillus macauensis ZFHKF-1]
MSFRNPSDSEIQAILQRKKRIAVVGLGNDVTKPVYGVSQVMQAAGYEIIPVHPKADEVLGVKAVRSLKEITGHVDIVNVFRRSEYLPQVATEAVEIGADVFWAQLGLYHEDVPEILKPHDIVCIMDRCLKIEYARLLK